MKLAKILTLLVSLSLLTVVGVFKTNKVYAASCLVNPTSSDGRNFNVGGLGFDPDVGLHSVSATGVYPKPENTFNDLALMSYDPVTGAWSATVILPATAPAGDYLVRVDSVSCSPNLSVTSSGEGKVECTNFINCVSGFTEPIDFEADSFVGQLVSNSLNYIIVFGGFISVIMIVVSGIQFITSSGNPESAAAARGRLTFALVGFVLLTLAYAIAKVVDIVFLKNSGVF